MCGERGACRKRTSGNHEDSERRELGRRLFVSTRAFELRIPKKGTDWVLGDEGWVPGKGFKTDQVRVGLGSLEEGGDRVGEEGDQG